MKNLFPLLFTLLMAAFLFEGCENKGDPPVLPPPGSMSIDFSYFSNTRKSAATLKDDNNFIATDNTNWTVAATVAGIWKTILVYNLSIPVAAFEKAIESNPQYIDNKTWQWKYSVNVLAATYTARLTGQIKSDSVKWEMYIKMDGVAGFTEFKWFEGTSARDGSGGKWILMQSQVVQVPMLEIEWEKTGTEPGSIKYTYIKAGDSFNGSFIEYGKTTGSPDAFFNVHFWESNRAKFTDVNIRWSTLEFNGRVQAPDYFQDNDWHCWDADGNDTSCQTK